MRGQAFSLTQLPAQTHLQVLQQRGHHDVGEVHQLLQLLRAVQPVAHIAGPRDEAQERPAAVFTKDFMGCGTESAGAGAEYVKASCNSRPLGRRL